ncbi:hypothetical protein AB0J86_13015 [Micromonospora sp. NPDC049559]|uniref:hypothetical protein n=1 Tax=Micromonospora sp. NPDC049559 TaxID=3155923 RepID=UPI00342F4E45
MRDAATPPDDDRDAQPPAALTPQQRAANIRAAAAEVLARLQEWRDSPNWPGDTINLRRYHRTADAVSALNSLPDVDTLDDLAALVDAIRPILIEWRPSRPGPKQAIYVATERLRKVAGK